MKKSVNRISANDSSCYYIDSNTFVPAHHKSVHRVDLNQLSLPNNLGN